jgi:hypothetical protein
MFGGAQCLYNFQDKEVEVLLNRQPVKLAANALVWKE